MKKQIYKVELRKAIKKSGRTRCWLSEQLEMNRMMFWRKVNSNTLTKEQKQRIEKLLST